MLGINIFNKEYPEFWKNYVDSFKKKATKYTVISMETTGLNPEKDLILSVACTSVVGNKIIIKDSFELFLQHTKHKELDLDNEFITLSKVSKVSEKEAIENIINFIGNSVLIGHRVNFDIEILDECLSRLKLGKIRNEAFDIEAMFNKFSDTSGKDYAIDQMCNKLNIVQSERNSVADDCYSIALIFLKLKDKLKIK